MSRRRFRSASGQALILVALAMPVFLGIALFVVDGSAGFVKKRQMQNAADASALAAARDLTPALDPSCDSTCLASVRANVAATAGIYSAKNGGPGPGPLPQCTQPSDRNCYTWPYNGSNGKVEVRLRTTVATFFTNLFGLAPDFLKAGARAVANATGITTTHCVFTGDPPVVNPDQYLPSCVIPGTPDHSGTYVPGIDGAQAFTMSPECDAIFVTGSNGATLGGLGTNGGLTFGSVGATPKKAKTLGSNRSGCPNSPVSPPSGDPSQCKAIAYGDATDSNNLCVKTLIDWSAQIPMNWPVPPPTVPTPLASGTWTASTDYPSKCTNLGISNLTFTPSATHTATSGPPGIYCFTGSSNRTLSLNGDFTTGDGYTFFALNGSTIHISSNGTKVKYYYPSDLSCGGRPGATSRPSSFTCFGRTITNYDPQTMFYSTNTFHNNTKPCDNNAICIDGQNTVLDGDIFATSPSTFPPPNPTTSGGTIFVAGGSASAGSGFLQSWWLTVQGNNGNYNGTGPSIGAHCVFTPPVVNPDQYLPSCVISGTPDRNGTPVSSVTGANLSMDE
jgi:Putative Flp pilus-assembly TadE/G-like